MPEETLLDMLSRLSIAREVLDRGINPNDAFGIERIVRRRYPHARWGFIVDMTQEVMREAREQRDRGRQTGDAP